MECKKCKKPANIRFDGYCGNCYFPVKQVTAPIEETVVIELEPPVEDVHLEEPEAVGDEAVEAVVAEEEVSNP